MNKIILVIKREYLTRVRKKSFIIMTLATPLLITAFYAIIIYFAINRDIGDTDKKVYVVDQSGAFTQKLTNSKSITFEYGTPVQNEAAKTFLDESGYYAILTIPDSTGARSSLVAIDQPSITTQDYIEDQLADVLKKNKLAELGISASAISQVESIKVGIETAKATETGAEASSAGASTAIGYITALIIYFFIFLYGVQVMRGVIEEKTNRIVEVIISSLKPFELMMGKIVGIALVGLTQFLIWVALITVLGGAASGFIASQMHVGPEAAEALQQGSKMSAPGSMNSIMGALLGFDYVYLVSVFVFYFITGYLFYGSLFAAIGSAVDNETEVQQFMLPITMPLVLALIISQSAVISDPNGPLAFWLSIVPLTSPIGMMVRLPFGVPTWELLLSMTLMVLGFIGTTWIAARIYRIGILMYGQKPSYKNIVKWLFSKG